MAFKKSELSPSTQEKSYKTFLEAQEIFKNDSEEESQRLHALDYIIRHKEIYYILDVLNKLFHENQIKNHVYINFAFTHFGNKPKSEEDFNKLLEMLKSQNAYLRNSVIRFLQDYDTDAISFIQTLMNDPDRDIRIFAINILGDVKFESSIDMLRHFIAKEQDVNALMTAIDYLGEIGDESDVVLLKTVEQNYQNNPYVSFGVNLALKRLKGES